MINDSTSLDTEICINIILKLFKEKSCNILDDPIIFDSILKDLIPKKTKEIYLLTCSVKENIPKEIQKLGSKSELEPDFTILINRIRDKYCIQKEYAEWVVNIWNSVFIKNDDKLVKIEKNDLKETSEVVKIGKTDLNVQEIESIIKEEIKSLSDQIYTIDLEKNITRKFLVIYCGVTIFLIIIQLISIPFSTLGVFLSRFFGEGFFVAIIAVPIIIGFLFLIANIILLSIIVSYRNKATKFNE